MSSSSNILGYENTSKLLRKFAIPSIIAMLVSSLYNIVDQIFIGQGVGYLGNAATNVAFPLTTICLAIALLIGVGSASGFSLELGAGHDKKAAQYVGNAIGMMLIAGVLYLILIQIFLRPMLIAFGSTQQIMPYAESYTRITSIGMPFLIMTNGLSNLARADGSPKYSMLCMVVGAIINTILDPIFIFILQMGVAGAAWATIIGQFASFLLALAYIPRFKHVQLDKKAFRPQLRIWTKISSLGISNSLNQVAITLVQIVLNNSLTYYGALSVYGSEIPLAGCGIVMKVNSILISVFVGISQGSQPIIGFNYGAAQYSRVRGTYKSAILGSMVISTLGFLMFQFCPEWIISIFGSGDPLYYEFSVRFMRIFLFMVITNGIQIISSNFFSAIGKPLRGVLLSLTRQVFFLIPLILVLPLFMGLDGILFAAPIADAIAFIVSFLLIRLEFTQMKQKEACHE